MRAEHVTPPIPAALRGLVGRWTGYRYDGLQAGTHLGMPSPLLTVVISLAAPTQVRVSSDPAQGPTALGALVGGLHTQAAVIAFERELFGMQLDLTPAGARALLGLPAGALGPAVSDLRDVLGPAAARLHEALHDAPDWRARFGLLERALLRRAGAGSRPMEAPLAQAWRLLVGQPELRVRDVAAEVGWSRRQLQERFGREFGVTPKQAAQLSRFARSQRLLQERARATLVPRPGALGPARRAPSLAVVAAETGYADQAHMAREWNQLAGCPPSRWLADEELPFVQDESW